MIHICPSHQEVKTNCLDEKTSPPKQLMMPSHKAFPNIFQQIYKAWFMSLLTIIISIVYLDIELRAQVVGMQNAGLSFWAIAAHSNLPLSTVYKTIQRFNL
ncbi:hypothetical protein O181_117924 [Austropuccinia psidii MF-1]|uniref:Uncharacterized protein n=1 Tax=Austropuccinia psidii MF-1 TaxID=1389203 RepID=A0A9Q3PXZ4_9BASI|nr:hypothetical protein [Austropuccinia psidii MF-1]